MGEDVKWANTRSGWMNATLILGIVMVAGSIPHLRFLLGVHNEHPEWWPMWWVIKRVLPYYICATTCIIIGMKETGWFKGGSIAPAEYRSFIARPFVTYSLLGMLVISLTVLTTWQLYLINSSEDDVERIMAMIHQKYRNAAAPSTPLAP